MVTLPLLRERVARGDDEREVVVVEVERLDFRMLGEARDGDVDFAGEELLDHVFGLAGAEVDVDARARLAEALEDAGQDVGGDGGACADADAADIAVADGLDGVGAFLDGGERALGVGHEGVPGIGQGDAAAGAFEEALADLAFERLDAGGDRWLREEERFRRAAERAVVRHLDECFELGEFQECSSRGFTRCAVSSGRSPR